MNDDVNKNKIPPEQNEKYLEVVRKFRLIDDDFMKAVFEDKECVQLLLRIILDIPDIEVKSVKTEYIMNNMLRHGVRFDIFAVDSSGREYDIEIQRRDKGAGRKRARYNSSLLDSYCLEPGEDYEKLPETYVIFITENDVMKKNLPIYHIERMVLETGELFDDKTHIIYVNNEVRDDTPLGKLMQDFKHTRAEDMNYKVLAEKVRHFKEDEEGVRSMCSMVEELCREAAAEEAKARAEAEAKMAEAEAKAAEAEAKAARAKEETAVEIEKSLRESGIAEDIISMTLSRILKPQTA